MKTQALKSSKTVSPTMSLLPTMFVLLCVTLAQTRAAPLPQHIPAEHRAAPGFNLLEDIPISSDNSFVWRFANGAYRFGIKAPDQWRVERRHENGAVEGQYFYRTPDGGQVNMSYNTGGTRGSSRRDGTVLGGSQPRPWLQVTDRVGGAGEVLRDDSEGASLTLPLRQGEELMPYGALKVAVEDTHRLRANDPDTHDHRDLLAVVTEVRHHK